MSDGGLMYMRFLAPPRSNLFDECLREPPCSYVGDVVARACRAPKRDRVWDGVAVRRVERDFVDLAHIIV